MYYQFDASDTVFFFNDTATTEIYTLSLHDALPIYQRAVGARGRASGWGCAGVERADGATMLRPRGGETLDPTDRRLRRDRKSTRLNSSHANISYAVFCLKKKKSKYRIRKYLHNHTQ